MMSHSLFLVWLFLNALSVDGRRMSAEVGEVDFRQSVVEAMGNCDDGCVAKAKNILYSVSQSMRYLADYEPTASFWQQVWTWKKNKDIFGGSLKDMEFLTGAIDTSDEMSGFVERPVDEMKEELPAGAMPIMVEIWDQDTTSGEFVGEAGAALKIGRHSYDLQLRPNPSRSMKTYGMASKRPLGRVAFDTTVSIDRSDPPKACTSDASKICAEVSVTVTCKSASNLVNTDTFSLTDPYCKVRVKQDEDRPSTKDKTPYVSNDLNPTWQKGSNSFTHRWEVELVPPQGEDDGEGSPVAELVPLTWDRMTSLEQMLSNMQFYIQAKFLGGKRCKDIDGSSPNTAQKVCGYLAALSQDGVDEAVVREVAADTEDEELKAGLARIKDQVGAGGASLVEVEAETSEEGRFHPAAVHAGMRAGRRRRPHGGGGRGRPSGGEGGGGGGWGVLILVLLFIVLLPVGL